MFCPHSPQWRVPHQEAAGQLPGDVGEHLPASVWSHHRPPQSPRAPPLLRTRQCLFTPSIHTRSWRLTLLWWRCFFFFSFYFPAGSNRWWASTAWTTSPNLSNTSSTWTVRCRPTGQRRTTPPTPTTCTTPTPTWLCWTTWEGRATSWETCCSVSLCLKPDFKTVFLCWNEKKKKKKDDEVFIPSSCDLTAGRRGQSTTWCQVSSCRRTSLTDCCSERSEFSSKI